MRRGAVPCDPSTVAMSVVPLPLRQIRLALRHRWQTRWTRAANYLVLVDRAASRIEDRQKLVAVAVRKEEVDAVPAAAREREDRSAVASAHAACWLCGTTKLPAPSTVAGVPVTALFPAGALRNVSAKAMRCGWRAL